MIAAVRLRRLVVAAIALLVLVGLSTAFASACSSHVSRSSTPTAPIVTGGRIAGPPPTVKVVAPLAPSGAVREVPASIARDCSVDVAPALQSWIDSVPDNSTLSFAPKACFRIDEPVRVKQRHRMLLDGNGAALKAVTMGGRNRSQLVLAGGGDLTV